MVYVVRSICLTHRAYVCMCVCSLVFICVFFLSLFYLLFLSVCLCVCFSVLPFYLYVLLRTIPVGHPIFITYFGYAKNVNYLEGLKEKGRCQ